MVYGFENEQLLEDFNSMEGDLWASVYCFNLKTRELALSISTDKSRFLEPHGRMRILELVSFSEDGCSIYVRIRIEKVVSGGGIIDYYLARVDFRDQEVKLQSRLMDI